MITKKNGLYEVNGKILSSAEMQEIFNFVEKEYYTEDVLTEFENEIEIEIENISPVLKSEFSKLINNITEDYMDKRSDNSDWGLSLDNAFEKYSDEINLFIMKNVIYKKFDLTAENLEELFDELYDTFDDSVDFVDWLETDIAKDVIAKFTNEG